MRASLVPFLFCLAILLFLKSKRQPKYLIFSAFAFALSLHTYYSARVIVPLFLIGLVFVFWQELWQMKKHMLISSALFVSILTPLALFWISPQGMARANETLAADPAVVVSNLASYYGARFLFLEGDPNIRHSLPGFGQLHLFELVTVPMGLWALSREKRKDNLVFVLWLIVYPIPAAFTEPGHAMRSMVGAPLFAFLSAKGLFRLFDITRNLKIPLVVASCLVVGGSSIHHLKSYFFDYPKYSALAWQYGMREAIAFTERNPHEDVIISRRLVPYIFVLFYTKFPPHQYLSFPLSLRESMWVQADRPLGKYYFPSIRSVIIPEGTGLVVCRPEEVMWLTIKGYDWRKIHDVIDPLGKTLITIVEVSGMGLPNSVVACRSAIRNDPTSLNYS